MTRVLIIEPGYCPYQAAFDSPQAAISEVIEECCLDSYFIGLELGSLSVLKRLLDA